MKLILSETEEKYIPFQLAKSGFYAKARGIKCEDSYSFCCPVNLEKVVAKYSDGVLKVTVPSQQPFVKMVNIKLN
jgi:HSP20 family protein